MRKKPGEVKGLAQGHKLVSREPRFILRQAHSQACALNHCSVSFSLLTVYTPWEWDAFLSPHAWHKFKEAVHVLSAQRCSWWTLPCSYGLVWIVILEASLGYLQCKQKKLHQELRKEAGATFLSHETSRQPSWGCFDGKPCVMQVAIGSLSQLQSILPNTLEKQSIFKMNK